MCSDEFPWEGCANDYWSNLDWVYLPFLRHVLGREPNWPDDGWTPRRPRLSTPHADGVFVVHSALVLMLFGAWTMLVGPINTEYSTVMEALHRATAGGATTLLTPDSLSDVPRFVVGWLTGPQWKTIRLYLLGLSVALLVVSPWLRWVGQRLVGAWGEQGAQAT